VRITTIPDERRVEIRLEPVERLRVRGLFDVTQTCSLAAQSAEVEEARAPHFRRADQVDLVDNLGVDGEYALDALSEADLADGEAGLRAVVALDYHAFERLHAFLIAFFNLYVDADGVSGAERREVGALRFREQLFDNQV